MIQQPNRAIIRHNKMRLPREFPFIAGLIIVLLGLPIESRLHCYAQSDPDSTSDSKRYVFRQQEVFKYSNRGRRDPFKALIQEGVGEINTNLLNMEEATLTGIVWAGDQMVALFKDKKGKSYYMRKGDAVNNGRIVEIKDNSVIVSVFQFGDTRQLEFRVTEHVSDGSGG